MLYIIVLHVSTRVPFWYHNFVPDHEQTFNRLLKMASILNSRNTYVCVLLQNTRITLLCKKILKRGNPLHIPKLGGRVGNKVTD
jgi:hypothetical protein